MWKLKKYSRVLIFLLAIYIISNFSIIARYPIEYTLYWIVLLSGFIAIELLGNKCIAIYIFCIAAYVMGIFQPIDSVLHSSIYSDTMRITLDTLLNTEVRIQYLVYLNISYIIMYLTLGFILNQNRTRIGNHQSYKVLWNSCLHICVHVSPIVVALFFSAFRFLFQMRFSILMPGGIAKIPYVAIWVYLIRILSLYMWTVGYNYYLTKVHNFKDFLFKTMLFMLACCFPEILIGSRSSFIVYMAQGVVSFIIYNKNFIGKMMSKIMIAGVILTIFAGISIVLSNFMRTGSMSSVLNFLRIRVVGITDGIVVINYLNHKGETLSFIEYFLSLMGFNDVQALASFYTHDVVGYPSELVHSYALPGFISGTLYLGKTGIIFSSILIALICGFCERKSQMYVRQVKGKETDAKPIIIYAYIYIYVVFLLLFEGNIDKIIAFIVPALCSYFIMRMVKIEFGRKSGKKEYVTNECSVNSAI